MEVTKPPMTTVARGRWTSAPTVVASAMGRKENEREKRTEEREREIFRGREQRREIFRRRERRREVEVLEEKGTVFDKTMIIGEIFERDQRNGFGEQLRWLEALSN